MLSLLRYVDIMDLPGLEPGFRVCNTRVFPLDDKPLNWKCETRTPPLRPERGVQTFTPHSQYNVQRGIRTLKMHFLRVPRIPVPSSGPDAEREDRTLRFWLPVAVFETAAYTNSAISASTRSRIRTDKTCILSAVPIPVRLCGHMLPKGFEPSVVQGLSLMRLPVAPRQRSLI